MRSYEFYRQAELEAALGADGSARLRAQEVGRLVDRAVRSGENGVVITDARVPDNPIVYVNPGFEQMTGYTSRETVGENCRFLQKDDRDQPDLEELRAALREGCECRVMLRNYRKDGTLFWNELSVFPVYDEEGRLTNFVGVQNDITERRRVEAELEKSEDRLRLAVEATGLGTWDFNPLTGELQWDERCKAMFGLPPEAGVDYGVFLDGLHPEDRERADRNVRRALDPAGGGRFDAEYRTVGLTDGVERWVAARGQAFFDEVGRAVRFIGTVLDVTGRKRVEEERDLLLARERQARTEAVAARRRLALLAKAGPLLSAASIDYAATLEQTTRLAVPELADWCLLNIVEEDGSVRQLAAAHADPAKERLLRELAELREPDDRAPQERSSLHSALQTGEPVLLTEVPDEVLVENAANEAQLSILRQLEPRSCIIAPLRARNRTLGTVVLVSSREDYSYDTEDLALVQDLARRCALAVDNARLYGSRSEIARTLQESLLPSRLPEIPGVEVGLSYLPAGEVDVGGDFYDLFDARTCDDPAELPSSWGVVIGDVVGKGAEAAAVLALARYAIRAVAMREPGPAAILAGLNETMLRQRHERDDHKFCTVAYVRLEIGPRPGVRATVCLGGHSTPLLLRAGGEIRKVGVPGRAVGVFEDPNLVEQEIDLSPGDALVLYTDGVIEARSPDGAFFGEERLATLLRSLSGLDAQSLAARVENAVLEFQQNSPSDDIAVLVLQVSL